MQVNLHVIVKPIIENTFFSFFYLLKFIFYIFLPFSIDFRLFFASIYGDNYKQLKASPYFYNLIVWGVKFPGTSTLHVKKFKVKIFFLDSLSLTETFGSIFYRCVNHNGLVGSKVREQ